jgi:hypothetical protein
MSGKNKHIIQKQFLEVEMQNPPDAFAFRNRLGELYYQRILPELEGIFDEIGSGQKLIRKDFLEIDVGIIASENWEELFVDKTLKKIREALVLESPMYITASAASVKSETGDRKISNIPEKLYSNPEDIFFFFLENGFLPWHVSKEYDLRKAIRFWIEEHAHFFKKSFVDALRKSDRKVFLRLIYQFDEELLNQVLGIVLEKTWWEEVRQYEKEFKNYFHTITASSSVIRKLFYYPLFQSALSTDNNWATVFLLSLIEETKKEKVSVSVQAVLKEMAILLNKMSGIKSISTDATVSLFDAIGQLQAKDILPQNKKADEEVLPKKGETETGSNYIQNAGLVILHPFLPLFFNHLGLSDDKNNFKDEASHQKAVLLSQYLVTGDTSIVEEGILLNKIICGYPIEEPIIKELELSEFEMAEAIDLLAQVIQSWKMSETPVNNTIEGLQQSFLQRQGKLLQKDADWLLQVEQKSYDMVLSSLPWSIGIIKNAWMKDMLWVEWT